jgi:hypothetical protein
MSLPIARRLRSRWTAAAVIACVSSSTLGAGSSAWNHPLHTTLTEVTLDAADGTTRVTIRAFADDFSAAAARHAHTPPPADGRVSDAVAAAYVLAAVRVTDPSAQPAPLTWGGMRRTGNLLWITMRIPSLRSLDGVKLGCAILFELYADQVNIVQAAAAGRRRTLLFTPGDGGRVKALF